MKLRLTVFLILICGLSYSQSFPYNVVIDITSNDTTLQQSVMRWVKGITREYKDANVEVVFYGKSLDMISKGKSILEQDIAEYSQKQNVSFTVCEQAMKRNNITKDQLIAGVKSVPDGIHHIIKRQHEGWGYIKAAR